MPRAAGGEKETTKQKCRCCQYLLCALTRLILHSVLLDFLVIDFLGLGQAAAGGGVSSKGAWGKTQKRSGRR